VPYSPNLIIPEIDQHTPASFRGSECLGRGEGLRQKRPKREGGGELGKIQVFLGAVYPVGHQGNGEKKKATGVGSKQNSPGE